ncbi:bifunctional nuclease family protein [Bacteroidales bacterium OttesenSCG-928-M11]|nr:bifunctional nuclease family protein [Bacteroidales bacterium OttesenSCG-928-M11]
MNKKSVSLKIVGVTFSQVQAGAYALILAEEEGPRRLPIIIGTPEAQSIAIHLEGLNPPRPLTHDLFMSFVKKINAEIHSVFIYKYDDGVFLSRITFRNKEGVFFDIDSRTSDAIALAIRAQAPVITTEEIMQQVSVVMDMDMDISYYEEINEIEAESAKETEEKSKETDYEKMTKEELRIELDEAIRREDYEKASSIRDIINKQS